MAGNSGENGTKPSAVGWGASPRARDTGSIGFGAWAPPRCGVEAPTTTDGTGSNEKEKVGWSNPYMDDEPSPYDESSVLRGPLRRSAFSFCINTKRRVLYI